MTQCSNEEHVYTGSFIPASVMEDEDYTSTEKILYAEIQALSNPWCFASNAFFMNRLKCCQKVISTGLTKLKNKGDIVVETDGNNRRIRCSDRLVKNTKVVKNTSLGSKKYYLPNSNNREKVVKNTTIDIIDNKLDNSRLPSLVDINGKKKSVSNIIYDLCSLFDVTPDRKGGYASKVKKFENECIDFINSGLFTYDELMLAAGEMMRASENKTKFTPGVSAALSNTEEWLARAKESEVYVEKGNWGLEAQKWLKEVQSEKTKQS